MIYRRVLMFVGMGLSLSGSAFADLRVLFTFDELGVRAQQVVKVADLGENYPTSVAELSDMSQDSGVMMKWVDSNGQLLALTQIPTRNQFTRARESLIRVQSWAERRCLGR